MRARLLALVLGLCPAAQALGEVYQTPEAFVAEVFGAVPAPRVLWLSREVQAGAAAILDHPPANLRQRYWSDGARSVWILEEIGKEELITAGFVISQGRIDHGGSPARNRILWQVGHRGPVESRAPRYFPAAVSGRDDSHRCRAHVAAVAGGLWGR